MTSLRGNGRAPRSIQICQSTPGLAQREVVGFDAADARRADERGRGDVVHARRRRAPVEQVGQRHVDVVALCQAGHHLADLAGDLDAAVVAHARCDLGQRLAVEVEVAPLAVGADRSAQLVRRDIAVLEGAAKLHLLAGLEHLVLGGFGLDGEGLQRTQVIAHLRQARQHGRVAGLGRGRGPLRKARLGRAQHQAQGEQRAVGSASGQRGSNGISQWILLRSNGRTRQIGTSRSATRRWMHGHVTQGPR